MTSLAGHFLEEGRIDSEDDHQTYISPKHLNKMKELSKRHSQKKAVIEENSETCFYFYQAVSGENLFLHPLCLEILQHDMQLNIEKKKAASA